MSTEFQTRHATHPDDYPAYGTRRLRELYLVTDLFQADTIQLTYTHYERYIVGGALPVTGSVVLETIEPLKSATFLARRELGVINVGGSGKVSVDGSEYQLACKEALYVGAGAENVEFSSDDAENPARFYLNSAPAHKSFPTRKIGREDADVMALGSPETCNERRINKLLVNSVLETCQLQMGLTEFSPGSVWNTMPAHTHDRRIEVYFYFDIPEGQAVCHFMGPKEETRHIWVNNEQVVLSPPWSMHCGVGTGSYTFIWGMAGENLDYSDMDTIQPNELR